MLGLLALLGEIIVIDISPLYNILTDNNKCWQWFHYFILWGFIWQCQINCHFDPSQWFQLVPVNAVEYYWFVEVVSLLFAINFDSVDFLKFWTLVACQKGSDKHGRTRSDCFWRSSLIWVYSVCYSGKHFVNSGADYQHLILVKKKKCEKF